MIEYRFPHVAAWVSLVNLGRIEEHCNFTFENGLIVRINGVEFTEDTEEFRTALEAHRIVQVLTKER